MQTEALTVAAEKKAGRPPARPEGEKPLTVRLPVDLYRLLKGLSSIKGMAVNDSATEAIREWSAKFPNLVEAIQREIEEEKKTVPAAKPTRRAAKKTSPKKSN